MRHGAWIVLLAMSCRFDPAGLPPSETSRDVAHPDATDLSPEDQALGDTAMPVDAARPEAAQPDMAQPDSSAPDAQSTDIGPLCKSGLVYCNGSCISGTDCTGCSTGKLFCKATGACLSSCATCSGLADTPVPIECFACDKSQNNPIGTCEYDNTSGYCLNADYSTAFKGGAGEHCDCSNTNVTNCVGNQHVCKPAGGTDWCVTCGESGISTNGLPCKGGGTCNTSVSPPRCQ